MPATLRAFSSGTGLRRTLIAYALYDLVEFAIWMAIILFAFDAGGASLAAIAAVVQLLPAVVISPVLAGIGDRMARGTALAVAHAEVVAATMLTTVALVLAAPMPVVIAASTTATTAVAVVRPIHFAALPQLAQGPDELVSANSLSSVADGIALFVGPMLAGFGVALAGPWLVLVGATAASSVAIALCMRLGLEPPAAAADGEPEGWRAAAQGLGALWGDWGSLALLLALTTNFVIGGALDVLGVSFSESVLDRGQSGAGIIIGAIGIGELVGALAAASISRRRYLAPVVVVGGVVQGLGFSLVAGFHLLAPTMGAIALAGVGGALMMVSGRTLLQRATDDRVLARVFAVQEGISLLGLAIGAAIAPTLIGKFSPAGAFLPLGLGAAMLTLASVMLIRRLDARAVFLPTEISLLQGVPFLSVLPPYELERLARTARWVDVSARTDVVRQGEPGDAFLVIGQGDFSVNVDGVTRPEPLRIGDSFGEIALLHSVPRTATVRSLTPGRLLVLQSEDFLSAVTGSEDGRAVAAEVTAAHYARDRAAAPDAL
jgi:Cyclic nucleotide-binding domain